MTSDPVLVAAWATLVQIQVHRSELLLWNLRDQPGLQEGTGNCGAELKTDGFVKLEREIQKWACLSSHCILLLV